MKKNPPFPSFTPDADIVVLLHMESVLPLFRAKPTMERYVPKQLPDEGKKWPIMS